MSFSLLSFLHLSSSGLDLLHLLAKLSILCNQSVQSRVELLSVSEVVQPILVTGVQVHGGRLGSLWRGTLVGRSLEGIHNGLRRGSEVATRFVNLA